MVDLVLERQWSIVDRDYVVAFAKTKLKPFK